MYLHCKYTLRGFRGQIKGAYTVTVTAPGYQTATVTGTAVAASVTHLEARLTPTLAKVTSNPRGGGIVGGETVLQAEDRLRTFARVSAQPATAYPPQPPGYGVSGVPACRTACPPFGGLSPLQGDWGSATARWTAATYRPSLLASPVE